MNFFADSVTLRYKEENAFIVVLLRGESAEIERVGDYTLRLQLKRGEMTQGILGMGGMDGEIETFTHKVAYSMTKDSLLLSLQYDLIISGEIQKMKLRVLGRYI